MDDKKNRLKCLYECGGAVIPGGMTAPCRFLEWLLLTGKIVKGKLSNVPDRVLALAEKIKR